tara:strand:- start:127 stop:1035 length:909 start_codon:yes stop_codon:yes gene_type:complete
MNLKYSVATIIVSAFLFGCGEDLETEEIVIIDSSYITGNTSGESDSTEVIEDPKTLDAVAFKPHDSDTIMVATLDGKIIGPHTEGKTLSMQWPEKELIISRVCGNEMEFDKRVFNFFSPDGGTVDISVDEWFPPMRPDRLTVAVTCKPVAEDEELIIVVDDSTLGDRSDWSRSGRGELSDGVNIYLISTDGSRIHNMTYMDVMPDSGEWLPQWSPDGEQVVFESNVEGDSEIAVATVENGYLTQITANGIDDRNPVWSRDGNFIIWTRDVGTGNELVAMSKTGDEFYTLIKGTPVPWNTWGE